MSCAMWGDVGRAALWLARVISVRRAAVCVQCSLSRRLGARRGPGRRARCCRLSMRLSFSVVAVSSVAARRGAWTGLYISRRKHRK